METLLSLIDPDIAQALTWTLIHSLWQGGAIALLMSLLHTRHQSAQSRYLTAIGALVTLISISAVTFYYYYGPTVDSTAMVGPTATIATEFLTTTPSVSERVSHYLMDQSSFILAVWLSGVLFFLVKLIFSLAYVQSLREGTSHPQLTYTLHKLQQKLQTSVPIKILESAKVTVPMVLGHLRPVILFPVGMVTQLTLEEVEGIVAHELAHIIRADYLANILVTIAETIYYYHPAVWWISANIKAERENCCDDLAIAMGADRVVYAKALVKLEELQSSFGASLAMTATGTKHQLINRIKRIIDMNHTKTNIREKSIAIIGAMTLVLLLSSQLLTGSTSPNRSAEVNDLVPSLHMLEDMPHHLNNSPLMSTIDTLPRTKSRISIQTDTNGKSMSMIKEDGKIVELTIDGKKIPPSEYDKYKDETDDVIIMDGNGSQMMWFGNGGLSDSMIAKRFNFDFDFDQMFDQNKMEELMERFEGFEDMQEGFAFPQMERLQEMMEELGGEFEEMRFDTIFQFDPESREETMRFFFNDEDNAFPFGDRSNSWSGNDKNVSEIIGAELNNDGLLEPYKENSVELTGKHLKINGDKQPKNIWGKYKRLYEEHTGMLMSKKSRIDFMVEGKKSTKKIRTF